MAWLPPSKRRVNETLKYFDKYDYPLTREELEFWAPSVTRLSVPSLKLREGKSRGELFFLPGREKIVGIRLQREKNSLPKWGIAYEVAVRLTKIPFVAAIFITGSLAMSNCKKSDDIDLMIITSPHTLWITRFIYNLLFFKNRRFPGVTTAPDKICPNLWLDTGNLKIESRSLYHAHEILQAKCIFDRGGVYKQFLKTNRWVEEYLPNAFRKSYQVLSIKYYAKPIIHNTNPIIQILNWLLFVLQYFYMKSKMTTERIGPGYAFFHPKT